MTDNRNMWTLIGIISVILLLFICSCCLCASAGWFLFNVNVFVPDPIVFEPIPVETVTPPPPPTIAPLPDEAQETLDALRAASIPTADLHELAIRFKGVPADTPRVSATEPADYPVGTARQFNVSNVDTHHNFTIEATLVYKTEHVYMWVETRRLNRVNEARLIEAADLFTEHTYPVTREFFGSEWTPGVDGDPRLSILHASNLGNTVAGYFSSPDSYVRAVRPDSNEMEMFYINIDTVTIGSPFYNGVLAHEFQHMIHWYNDINEETWLNEGCSELAMELNNRSRPGYYDVGGSEYAYLRRPDTQLTTWPEGTAGSAAPHYGAAYLFMSYFLDRFGEEATRALVAHPENGMDSFDAVLADLGTGITHKELFADWTIATLLDDADVDAGQFVYPYLNLSTPRFAETYRRGDYPVKERATVNQYGVDYIEVRGTQPLVFTFSGATETRLMDTTAYSGQYLWWSNRADSSNMRLTRRVDLSDVAEATLAFQAWYHIEEDWDYAYLVVGTTDSGVIPTDLGSPDISWTILNDRGLECRETDPNFNNFGCGFTGESQGWDRRSADLSAFAGQEIAVRFEYITDAAVNQAGFAVDDIEIVADGAVIFFDDVEAGVGDWIAEGFVRHANVLPQEWIVQLVTFGPETRVERLLLADDPVGHYWDIPLDSDTSRAVIVVSAIAPVTTEPAIYEYTLTFTPE